MTACDLCGADVGGDWHLLHNDNCISEWCNCARVVCQDCCPECTQVSDPIPGSDGGGSTVNRVTVPAATTEGESEK